MGEAQKARRAVLAIEIPRDELALRIGQIATGMIAPHGTDATEALNRMNKIPMPGYRGMGDAFRAQADAAVLYMRECINAGKASH